MTQGQMTRRVDDLLAAGVPLGQAIAKAVEDASRPAARACTGQRCRHCSRPVFLSGRVLRLVYVEYSRTELCDARGLDAGHEV
jgi:hypothetical protein